MCPVANSSVGWRNISAGVPDFSELRNRFGGTSLLGSLTHCMEALAKPY
jgi:hypothetical protein